MPLLLLFFLLSSCSSYHKFQTLYDEGAYLQAYDALKSTNHNDKKFALKEFQVIFQLSLEGNEQFLPVLDQLIANNNSEIPSEYINLAQSWIRFVSSSKDKDYQSILSTIPKERFSDPAFEQVRLTIYAYSLFSLKQYEAVIALAKSSATYKQLSDLLYVYGMSQLALKNQKEAIRSFQKAIQISTMPSLRSIAYYQMGIIYESQQKFEQAIKNYYQAWSENPYNGDLNFRLGHLLQKQNKYDDLYARFLRASLRLNPDTAEAWYYLNTQ